MRIQKPANVNTNPPTQEPENQMTTTNPSALTLLGSNELMSASAPPDTGNLLPQLKLVYPIDMQNEPAMFKGEHIFKLGIYDGNSFKTLTAPFILAAIASRNAARILSTGDDGGQHYERSYASIAGKGASAVRYAEMAKSGAEIGATFVVAVIQGEQIAICEFPTFKTSHSYWGRPLSTTNLKQKIGMYVEIGDHQSNLTTGKSGFSYTDPKKFKQWKQVRLTDIQVQNIANTLGIEDTLKRFNAWIEA